MSTGSRGMPGFQNEVTLGGRLVKAPATVRNESDDQIRFTLAHPYRRDKAYFIEVNVFGELATLLRDGDDSHLPFGKGDHVVIQGRLTSYSKRVGDIPTTRVTVVAEHVTRKKAGSSARPAAPSPAYEPEPGFDDDI